MGINNYAIELLHNQQPLYGPIYSLKPMELKILKAYIENNLVNGFIKPSKCPARVSVFCDTKLDKNPRLYMDYQNLNNLTIKNWYP